MPTSCSSRDQSPVTCKGSVDKPSRNTERYLLYIQILRVSRLSYGSKEPDNHVIKALNSFYLILQISSLWIYKTAKAFSLSCPVRFRKNVLMRFKVLNHLFKSAEDIGVVKIMLRNCDTAGNVLVREISRRIWKRFKAVPAKANLRSQFVHWSSSSSCFVGIIRKKIRCSGKQISRKMVAILSKLGRMQ